MEFLSFIYNNVIVFLVVITVLVFVHEMGHYLLARLFGVKVDTFSIGFGPELYGWYGKRSGTHWRVSAIPLGGYVKFFGDANPASMPSDNPSLTPAERAVSFHYKPVWQRFIVVLGGPLANILFAIFALALMLIFIGQSITPPIIGVVQPTGGAAVAGLQAGDRVLRADGRNVDSFEDVEQSVVLHPGIAFSMTVDRAGKRIDLLVTPAAKDFTDRFGNTQKVGDLGAYSVDAMPRIGVVASGGAAQIAGLKPGDLIVAVDGHAIDTFDDLRALIEPSSGKQLLLTIERDGQTLTVPVTPVADATDQAQPGQNKTGKPVGRIGIGKMNAAEHRKLDPATAAWQSGRQVVYMAQSIFSVIGQIIGGQRSAKDIGGPLGIAKMTGQAAQLGWEAVVMFGLFISVSLGVFNLLPVPLLDGGHLLFYVIEAVRGRPLTARLQEYGFRIGLALVFSLVIFATWNDLGLLKVTDLIGNIGR